MALNCWYTFLRVSRSRIHKNRYIVDLSSLMVARAIKFVMLNLITAMLHFYALKNVD